MDKLIICAAVTGMVSSKEDNPYIPMSVAEIIQSSVNCIEAGASIIHVHARDKQGCASYDKSVYEDIILGIRSYDPSVLICASTSGRTFKEFKQRSQVLELRGLAKPDLASLTLGSINFPTQASVNDPKMIMDLAAMMKEKGIMPEVEIFDLNMSAMLHHLVDNDLIGKYYTNVILGTKFSTAPTIRNLSALVDSLPAGPWACGAVGKHQLPMTSAAMIMGGNIRLGLEDNLYMKKGEYATNRSLINRSHAIAMMHNIKISTPLETRTTLNK